MLHPRLSQFGIKINNIKTVILILIVTVSWNAFCAEPKLNSALVRNRYANIINESPDYVERKIGASVYTIDISGNDSIILSIKNTSSLSVVITPNNNIVGPGSLGNPPTVLIYVRFPEAPIEWLWADVPFNADSLASQQIKIPSITLAAGESVNKKYRISELISRIPYTHYPELQQYRHGFLPKNIEYRLLVGWGEEKRAQGPYVRIPPPDPNDYVLFKWKQLNAEATNVAKP